MLGGEVGPSISQDGKGGCVGGVAGFRDPDGGVNCWSGQGAVVWLGAGRNASRWCVDTAGTW